MEFVLHVLMQFGKYFQKVGCRRRIDVELIGDGIIIQSCLQNKGGWFPEHLWGGSRSHQEQLVDLPPRDIVANGYGGVRGEASFAGQCTVIDHMAAQHHGVGYCHFDIFNGSNPGDEQCFLNDITHGVGNFYSVPNLEGAHICDGHAFYTIGGASFGLQAGGTASEVVLLAMTERGVTAFLSNSLKLGADVGLALGPIGAGAAAATANLSADIISFSRSIGLFGGVSLDGAVVATRDGLNEAYYGKKVNATDMLVQRNVKNRQADGLKQRVRQAAAGK